MASAKRKNMVFKIADKKNIEPDIKFWRGRSAEERLSAVEFLRTQFYLIAGFKELPRISHEATLRSVKSPLP